MDDKRILHGPPIPNEIKIGAGTTPASELILKYAENNLDALYMVDAQSGAKLYIRTVIEESKRLAAELRSLGCKPGHVVGIICDNRNEYMVMFLAILLTGATAAFFSHLYSQSELEHTLSLTKPFLVFVNTATFEELNKVKPTCRTYKYIVHLDSTVASPAYLNYEKLVQNGRSVPHTWVQPKVNADQTTLILFSSGSTGYPKAVMLSNKLLLYLTNVYRYNHIVGNATIISLLVLPFFHAYGLMMMLSSFVNGQTIIGLKKFEKETFLSAIERYRVNTLPVVPSLMSFLAYDPLVDKYDLSSLQNIVCGASPLGVSLENAVKRRFKLERILKGYTMTEMMSTCYNRSSEDKPGSVGRLFFGMSAKVIDTENGQILGANQVGELCFKGIFMMKGYFGDEKETEKLIDKDGWLHSGDVGYYDEDGDVFLVDRVKDIMKYKGFQVAPAELESLLLKHEAVADAAVVGIPDEEAGEVPKAFVVKRKEVTEMELLDYVSNNVAPYKKLRGGITFVHQIPRNPSGKTLRRILRTRVKSKL